MLANDYHIRRVGPRFASISFTKCPPTPLWPPLLSFYRMTVIYQDARDFQHSNDFIVENVLASSEDSIAKETHEVKPAFEVVVRTQGEFEEDYPDGGLMAWLIVAGVCH